MARGVIVVEGQGEVEAAQNLVSRLSKEVGLDLYWARPKRSRKLHLAREVQRMAEAQRNERDIGALLVLRDEDDDCPAKQAPRLSAALRELSLPFPTAVVLLHREYEVLFLPCIDLMAGRALGSGAARRPGIVSGTTFEGDPERIRGVKEWLTRRYPLGRSYKPSLDQLELTRMIRFDRLRETGLPCFGSLERALLFLAENLSTAGRVYPPAP